MTSSISHLDVSTSTYSGSMASLMCLITATQSAVTFLLLMQAECFPHDADVWCPVMHSGRKCTFFGHMIPGGQSRALKKPCVLVSCTEDAAALIVSGTKGKLGKDKAE
ncbi:uncharacterized protein LOC119390621 isoform X2 [Rhipicephalus sanguineus]|uniref:uncharacterized protein LOC119390621 isoform X2 n=1 Tax=Rhipicephalus sanguineus TaxID=34632 RepID=UPI0018935792|nr:uncharacterized protein LOC119390621 isoform X2 [Rhipicephalus sanguineus]